MVSTRWFTRRKKARSLSSKGDRRRRQERNSTTATASMCWGGVKHESAAGGGGALALSIEDGRVQPNVKSTEIAVKSTAGIGRRCDCQLRAVGDSDSPEKWKKQVARFSRWTSRPMAQYQATPALRESDGSTGPMCVPAKRWGATCAARRCPRSSAGQAETTPSGDCPPGVTARRTDSRDSRPQRRRRQLGRSGLEPFQRGPSVTEAAAKLLEPIGPRQVNLEVANVELESIQEIRRRTPVR